MTLSRVSDRIEAIKEHCRDCHVIKEDYIPEVIIIVNFII